MLVREKNTSKCYLQKKNNKHPERRTLTLEEHPWALWQVGMPQGSAGRTNALKLGRSLGLFDPCHVQPAPPPRFPAFRADHRFIVLVPRELVWPLLGTRTAILSVGERQTSPACTCTRTKGGPWCPRQLESKWYQDKPGKNGSLVLAAAFLSQCPAIASPKTNRFCIHVGLGCKGIDGTF